MMEIILVVLCVVLTWRAPLFLTADNLLNVLRNVSMQGVIAFGMTMVIISGEIDLSVGSMVAFSGCVCAWLVAFLTGAKHMAPVPAVVVAVPVTVLAGVLVGMTTGFLRVRFRVPTFIATLAWMTVLKGIAELLSNGFPIGYDVDKLNWFNFLGAGYVHGIPFPAILFVFVFCVIQFVMNYTSFGRSVYAVGGNAEAARLSGIKVGAVKIAVMATVAGLAALSGILLSSQIMSGASTSGVGWELDVIAAVIIGGCSLMGGAGRVWGTFVGVVFLGVLVNGMTLLNLGEYWQHVVRGALILGAVLINVAPASKSGGQT
jgi:ribose/xylose/arabinose/galactoside ABC-type transport system permease subunit